MRSLYASFRATTEATVGATTNVAVAIGSVARPCVIRRVRVRRLAGSAANYSPVLLSEDISGALGNQLTQEWAGGSTAVADAIDDSVELHTSTDEAGKLYLRFTPDAGTDNQFEYILDLTF